MAGRERERKKNYAAHFSFEHKYNIPNGLSERESSLWQKKTHAFGVSNYRRSTEMLKPKKDKEYG